MYNLCHSHAADARTRVFPCPIPLRRRIQGTGIWGVNDVELRQPYRVLTSKWLVCLYGSRTRGLPAVFLLLQVLEANFSDRLVRHY